MVAATLLTSQDFAEAFKALCDIADYRFFLILDEKIETDDPLTQPQALPAAFPAVPTPKDKQLNRDHSQLSHLLYTQLLATFCAACQESLQACLFPAAPVRKSCMSRTLRILLQWRKSPSQPPPTVCCLRSLDPGARAGHLPAPSLRAPARSDASDSSMSHHMASLLVLWGIIHSGASWMHGLRIKMALDELWAVCLVALLCKAACLTSWQLFGQCSQACCLGRKP